MTNNLDLCAILEQHKKWVQGKCGGERANLQGMHLQGANLQGADLSGVTGLLDPREWLSQFQTDEHGVIVFRAQVGVYAAPAHWSFTPGAYLTEIPSPDRCTECASGVHFATMNWVKTKHPRQPVWRCRIEWMDLAGVVVPYNTDGKARCARLKLIEIVEQPK